MYLVSIEQTWTGLLIENSFDGISFKQMRIFHMHLLGETTEKMGKANPPLPTAKKLCSAYMPAVL